MDSPRKLTPRIQLSVDAGYGLVRCTADQYRQLERLIYRRYPNDEWGAFFRFGYRKTGWGMLMCLVDFLPPARGDFDDRSPLVEFSPGYINRALNAFDGCEFGIGFIHSHPQGCAPSPSRADDDMDAYFATEFERFSGGRPYVSLIASRDESGQRSFSGRCFHKGEWLPVNNWLTCDKEVLQRHSDFRVATQSRPKAVTLDRICQLLGNHVGARLGNAVVGIVGCSGIGSPAAHVMARAGVGEFVLVDKGLFKPSNHERNHASRASDLGTTDLAKVELLQRFIREIRPDSQVTCISSDVLDKRAVDELARCDLILGCTDSYYARAALGDFAIHYQVPVIDLAVQMGSRDGVLTDQVGEVARYLPGLPCPWCRNRVNAAAIRAETASDEDRAQAERGAKAAKERGEDGAQYWIGQNKQELTVGYMTTAVAAMGAGYALNWLLGTGPMPHDRFQFDLGKTGLGFVDDVRESATDCSCVRCSGFADQGRADFTVSPPV
jgi:molybdopterin/thiamine biosynthesis adenylyltransferase